MSRAVTGDHVLFQEAIEFFRPKESSIEVGEQSATSYLLLDFKLEEKVLANYFTIYPTETIGFYPMPYRAFIAKVEFKTTEHYNYHLFALAVSAIISFVTERPVKSERNDYHSQKEITPGDKLEIAISFPVLFAGPGATHQMTQRRISRAQEEISAMTKILLEIAYGKYQKLMGVFRLIQLAHLNFKDDFALAFSLLIAAIEAVAQMAIKTRDVKPVNPNEEKWQHYADADEKCREIYKAYTELSSNNKHLAKKFTKFIFEYCPIEDWGDMEHPDEYIKEIDPSFAWVTEKKWWENNPSDIDKDKLEEAVSATYKYRSNFIHTGEQPPHKHPNPTNMFFEEQSILNSSGVKQNILITFRLMSHIAHIAVKNYILNNKQ